jgi:HSP20 family molecular chaperone IbpA
VPVQKTGGYMIHLLPTLFEELENCRAQTVRKTGGVSIGETDELIFVELPVPGCSKEKIQINYEKGKLSVVAEGDQIEDEKVVYLINSSRQYEFQVVIPRRIDEQIAPQAVYKDGILRVEFLKLKSERPQKIEIKTA